MSERNYSERAKMMFPPEYEGGRTITAGIYGTFRFNRGAERILEEDYGYKVSHKLALAISSPELAGGFRDYVLNNPDFAVIEEEPRHWHVKRRWNAITKSIDIKLVDPDTLARIVDGETVDDLADEEELVLAGNLHAGASNSKYETRTIRLK